MAIEVEVPHKMLRTAVTLALFSVALAVSVTPIIKPLYGMSVSFAQRLKSDEICKSCIEGSVIMYVAIR
jgi:hypothetical protein